MIENMKRSGMEFPEVELFHAQDASTSALTFSRASAQDILNRGLTLDLDGQMALRMASGEIPSMTLRLPNPSGKGDSVELELTQVNIFADGFTVITSSSNGQPVDYEKSTHYRGTVKGAPGSLAAISVLGDEVVGLYSTPDQGNFVLGRLGGDNPNNTHILYSQADMKMQNPQVCETKDDNTIIPQFDLQDLQDDPGVNLAGGCVRIYVEADRRSLSE